MAEQDIWAQEAAKMKPAAASGKAAPPVADPWAAGESKTGPTGPPGTHGMGTFGDTMKEVGSSLKGMVTGPLHAAFDTGTGDTGNPLMNLVSRSLVEPSVREFNTPSQKGVMVGGTGHPTIDKVMRSVPIVGPMTANADRINQDEGFAPAAASLVVPTVAGELGGPLLRGVGDMVKGGAAGLNDALIGTPGKSLRYGAEPGKEMARSGIVGSSPGSISSAVQERIPGAAADHRGIVAANPGGGTINVGPLVSDPFTDVMNAGTNPRTGAASPAQVSAAGRTQRQLTRVPDPDTGKSTPMMRDPNLSPLEATELKSSIYGRTNYENPDRYSLSNAGLKGAAHNLKSAVEQAVPESVESGQRLHNLMAIKDIVEPQARSARFPTSMSGIIDRVATGAGTRAAAGAYPVGGILTGLPTDFDTVLANIASASRNKDKE